MTGAATWPSASPDEEWDVVILGGGPAGCATSLALGRRSVRRVCIVEPGCRPGQEVGETIPPDARVDLQDLGVWDGFAQEGHRPCLGSTSAWGSETLGHNDFVLNPYGSGWHLDRPSFDAFLLRCAVASGAALVRGMSFVDCEPLGVDGYRLQVANSGTRRPDRVLTARFVVDATGSRAAFARLVGARRAFLDRLLFVYGFFDTTKASSTSQLTLLEAVDDGWWYAAELPGSRLALAFATDPEIAKAGGLARQDRWFARALRTRHVALRLDGCRLLREDLVIRAAPSSLLEPAAGRCWLAVGDAASTFDPISSQGIQKALADGIQAAEVIAPWLTSGTDVTLDYARAVGAGFEEYVANRNYFYRLEGRWPESPFWARRQERTSILGPASPPTTVTTSPPTTTGAREPQSDLGDKICTPKLA